MDLDALERILLKAGRAQPPSDKVPYAFEKRVMARLAAVRVEDVWSFWGKALWRGALASVAVSLILTCWMAVPKAKPVAETDLSEVYESTVFAAAEQLSDSW